MRTWVDIDLTFDKKKDGDINDFVGMNAVKSSISNILSTLKGDRRMIPEFALGAHELLFEPIDDVTAALLGEEILEAIEAWDDRVRIDNVNITPVYDKKMYEVQITFRVKNSNQIEQITDILVGE